jgi:[ribosomal protein S18]-alanine N-acetyltransferase
MTVPSKSSRIAPDAVIRNLTTADIPAILKILQESPEAAAWSEESLVQLASTECPVWIAELTGAGCTAGFLIGRIAADEFEILNMAVSRAHRRNGIASKLLESALKFSQNAGATRAYLEVRASNAAAIALYTRQGFTQCGRRTNYYRTPSEDALLLSLSLS